MLIFWSLDLEQMLIWQFFLWKSAIYHSIKLPFDAEVAEKILNVIDTKYPNVFVAPSKDFSTSLVEKYLAPREYFL